MVKIERLAAAFAAATPGDWDTSGEARVEVIGADDFPECSICTCIGGLAPFEEAETEKERNAEFIALAHTMMPDLLAAVRLLQAKMSPFTNNQETHEEALALLTRLGV